jgi:hypothetical protein
MHRLARRNPGLIVAALVALMTSGCIKDILADGQIASTREASAAVNTFSDWDVALRASNAGLAQFEGMHYLRPGNEDALFLLTRSWAAVGFGFIEDEMEQAEDQFGADSELAAYHKARAIAAYSRAIYYGSKLLDMRNEGFEQAKRNADTMNAWLANFEDEEDAEYLLWTAQAWLSRVNLLKDDSTVVADLFVGYAMVKRSVEIDPDGNYGTGHAILGAYHARSALSKNELPESKKHFDEALRITQGNALLVKFNYATKYHCLRVDKAKYVKILKDILAAGDTLPAQRLPNTIAKRRARRYLGKARMAKCGFDS